jgi:carotenoid cleavage dioxygenase-like enzyme
LASFHANIRLYAVGGDGHERIVLYAPMYHDYSSDVAIHTPKEPPAQLNKWVLDLTSGAVEEDRTLLTHGYERPSLNLAYVGKQSRFGYLIDEDLGGYMGKASSNTTSLPRGKSDISTMASCSEERLSSFQRLRQRRRRTMAISSSS